MADYADLFVSAADGLRLFARDYGPRTGTALAVRTPCGSTRMRMLRVSAA